MQSFQFRAMNSDIVLLAQGDTARLVKGFEQAQEFMHLGERRFSRFSEESELSELNRSTGAWFRASPDLFEIVALARRFFHQTRGLFDPSILPALKRAGYDRSMDLLRKEGAAPLLEELMANERPSFSEVELDESASMILLPAGMAIDLGGIAKGWLAERAAILLAGFSNACAVSAGGDMFLVGLPEGESHWQVDLEDPLQPKNILTTLKAESGAVATSAITKRAWKQGDLNRHHLIDPRTGEPAVTDWLSVTVLAPHACEAEVFAKALLIAGPQESENLARTSGLPLTYLAVDHERKIWGTQKSLEFMHVN